MSQETPEVENNEPQETPAETTENTKKSSLFGKLKIVICVLVVVVLECAAAYCFMPSAAESAALVGRSKESKDAKDVKEETKGPHDKDKEKDKEAEKERNEQIEVDLGEFNVTAFMPTSNTTMRIDFHLYGTVAGADQKEFMSRLEENLHRFRDQVIVTVRSAEITELTDAGLGLVKRKILDKTNRMMGKQLLRTVIFSDFSFIEQ